MAARGYTRVGIGLLATITALAVFAGSAAHASAADIHTAVNPSREGDLVKTIPISKKAWGKSRSVISLGPTQLGRLDPGNVIEAAADIQLTICITPNPRHPEPGQPCVGRYYDFDPRIKLKLVLAEERDDRGPATIPISKTYSYSCTEKAGHRNRHCVEHVPWSRYVVGDEVAALCSSCHINLIVSVFHPKAGRDHKVVVGTSDDNRKIHQGRSQINAAVYPSAADTAPLRTWRTSRRVTARPPVAAHGRDYKWRTVYSQKLTGLARGDQLLVDAAPVVANDHLPYPTHAHYAIVLTRKRSDTRHVNKISERIGEVGVPNGFTCTRNTSAHQSPCRTMKFGIISVKDPSGPVFVNLVIGQDARGTTPQYGRWRSSDKTKMRSSGFMRVRRFRGTMACATCALTRGFQSYDAAKPPADSRLAKLVGQLESFGLDRGSYSCFFRRATPKLACDWRSQGDFGGGSPHYECGSRAFFADPQWQIKPCKEALVSQLHRLVEQRGVTEVSTFGCSDVAPGEIHCNFNGRGTSGLWCSGTGRYTVPGRSWDIDNC